MNSGIVSTVQLTVALLQPNPERSVESIIAASVYGVNVVQAYSVPNDGITDATATLTAAFEAGGDLWVPQGDYLIAAAGTDAGGVDVVLTKSLGVRCHPLARFFTNGLDSDMLRFSAPLGGAGLTGKIKFLWDSGLIDQSAQKVSTSVPFGNTTYPPYPAKAGQSATTDGMSIKLSYTDLFGNIVHAASLVQITNLTVYNTSNWLNTTIAGPGGGDAGLFAGSGSDLTIVQGCRFEGCRDLGIYCSGDQDILAPGEYQGRFIVQDNDFFGCFGGVSFKRSVDTFLCLGNRFFNVITAIGTSRIAGVGDRGGIICENSALNYEIFARLDDSTYLDVHDNALDLAGALDLSGNPISVYGNPTGFWVQSTSSSLFHHNTGIGIDPLYATSSVFFLIQINGVGAVCTNNIVSDNKCNGWRSIGLVASGEEASSRYIENAATNAVNPQFIGISAGSFEVRVDQTSKADIFMDPIQFNSQAVGTPPFARRGQSDNGWNCATSQNWLEVGGAKRVGASSRGVFVFIPQWADQAAATGAGLVSGDLFYTPNGVVNVVLP